MPTIEFFGYRKDEQQRLESRVRERLADEPFHQDCVFVETAPSLVRDWHGASRPFLRVSTRSAERAERFKAICADLCDLEIVRIDFQPMENGDQACLLDKAMASGAS